VPPVARGVGALGLRRPPRQHLFIHGTYSTVGI
jgi:hypothetical protein